MTDREKVIKGLKIVWDAFNHMEHEMYADYVYDALALLKAQEPVEPIENAGFHYCGACRYAFTSARQKYCSECGQAVKWDG